ncbi:tyrosine---tRNA ligase [Synchytrium endobioticum]|uniref:Tyrosine--tRNA ligase n=1 Tax=Synchytrium endobioticum TaxID=286115 RepID=A0A507CGR2_9FUNG|nr:tyrosine---tRNA ligase [Synchytrium endobioticum]
MAARGLLADISRSQASDILAKAPTSVYAGFDPTAPSLHVGNLMLILALVHFQLAGHQPIALVGGATAPIGDPSFRSTARKPMPSETVTGNACKIEAQLATVFENACLYLQKRKLAMPAEMKPVKILNNLDWFKDLGLLDFLTIAGHHARISAMLARDSVKSRLDSAQGLSFAEFTYQLVQAYDFMHLNATQGCTVQLGGTDQWGNILAGLDLIRKKYVDMSDYEKSPKPVPHAAQDVFGLVVPLIVDSHGHKFGKSAGNALWLDKTMLSPFDFYQFFRRAHDSDVEKLLKYFTFLPLHEIELVMREHAAEPHRHLPQRLLALQVTELVHGEQEAQRAAAMTDILYDSTSRYSAAEIISAFASSPHVTKLPFDQVVNKTLLQVCVASKALPSKKSAKKSIAQGAVHLGKARITIPEHVISVDDTIDGKTPVHTYIQAILQAARAATTRVRSRLQLLGSSNGHICYRGTPFWYIFRPLMSHTWETLCITKLQGDSWSISERTFNIRGDAHTDRSIVEDDKNPTTAELATILADLLANSLIIEAGRRGQVPPIRGHVPPLLLHALASGPAADVLKSLSVRNACLDMADEWEWVAKLAALERLDLHRVMANDRAVVTFHEHAPIEAITYTCDTWVTLEPRVRSITRVL